MKSTDAAVTYFNGKHHNSIRYSIKHLKTLFRAKGISLETQKGIRRNLRKVIESK